MAAVRSEQQPRWSWGQVAGIAVALVLVGGPLAIVLSTATGIFTPEGKAPGFSFHAFDLVLHQPDFWTDVRNTVALAVCGTTLALVIGVTLAVLATRVDIPGTRRGFVRWLPVLAFLLPPVTILLSWHVLYSNQIGLVNIWYRELTGSHQFAGPINILTFGGVAAAQGVFLVPLVYISVQGALRNASAELEQAALTCGASWRRVIRTVTLPQIKQAVAAGGLLAFVLGLGTFLIPTAIKVQGLRTLSMDMRQQIDSGGNLSYARACAFSAILLVLCLIALAARYKIVRAEGATIPLRSGSVGAARLSIGKLRYLGLAAFLLYALIGVLLPMFAAAQLSFRGFWSTTWSAKLFSLNNYRHMTTLAPSAYHAIRDSMWIAFAGATLSMIVGVWFARLILRGGKLARVLEMMTFVPTGIPGIMFGLSLLIFSLRLWPSTYGTKLPVILAYTGLMLPFSTQLPLAALRRIPKDFEHASAVAGAPRRTTVTRVVLPLVLPELTGVWTLLLVIMMREVDAGILLNSQHLPLAGPEMLLNIWVQSAPAGMAFGYILLGATVVMAAIGGVLAFAYKSSLWLSSHSRMRHAPPRADLAVEAITVGASA
jgi:iron(III) transport system permease protein